MKRYGNIFDSIVDMDNLREAHRNARKNKTFYDEVKQVDANVDKHLRNLQESLINKTYTTSDYDVFIKSDTGKEREIHKLPYYPDRIVHWAIMQQIEHIFLETLIYDTHAALPNKGIHSAFKSLDSKLENRSETQYCLKIDIHKFFPSIDQQILKELLRKKIKDEKLLWLLDDVVESTGSGVPIGNYLSQYFGNFYLAYFDHWLKENKHIKYYVRYMDDMVIFHHDKRFLHQLRKDIQDYLEKNLNLTLKDNWQVFPTFVRGVDFVGYRHFGDYILLRKDTAKRMKRKLRRIYYKCVNGFGMSYSDYCSINSYNGWVMWCDGYNLTQKIVKPLEPYAEQYYKEVIKGESTRYAESC